MLKLLFSTIIMSTIVYAKGNIDFIKIEHYGISDKYIETILISKKRITKENDLSTVNYIVNENIYTETETYVRKEDNGIRKVSVAIEFGSFRVTLKKGNSIIVYILIGKKASKKYFQGLIQLVEGKGAENLLEAFNSRLKIVSK